MCVVKVSPDPGVKDCFTGSSEGFEGGTDGGIKGQMALNNLGDVLVPFVTSQRAD